MSLQDLFKDYYSKVKEVDTSDYVNSAKKSLNSFSSILERRRQQFKEGVKEQKEKKETTSEEATDKATTEET